MTIKPVRNEADYDAALEAIDGLMGAAPNTPDGDTLEVLVTLVEAYEADRWQIEAPDPVSMIEHVMGGARLAPKGSGCIDRVAATRVRSAQPTSASDPAHDSRLVARVETRGRHSGCRVRPCGWRITSGSRQGAGMTDTIGLLHPGEMGATVGAAARDNEVRVMWASEGRSPRTRDRARRDGVDRRGHPRSTGRARPYHR